MGHRIDERRRSSKVVILDGDGAVLLFCGGDPARPEAGVWWFLPGGGLDAAESFEDAALREVQEETGYVIDDPGPIVLRRWWSLDELADTHETVHPDGLAGLIVRHR